MGKIDSVLFAEEVEFRKEVAARIRKIMCERGMNQNELAIQAQTSSAAISEILNAKRSPSFAVLVRLARALQVSLSDLQPVCLDVCSSVPSEAFGVMDRLKQLPFDKKVQAVSLMSSVVETMKGWG